VVSLSPNQSSIRRFTVSRSVPLEVRDGHDATSGPGCRRLDAVAAVESRFVVYGVRAANHRFSPSFGINGKVLELAPAALGDCPFRFRANICCRSVRHCRVFCAEASISGRRLSISSGHSVFPIARSHPILCM